MVRLVSAKPPKIDGVEGGSAMPPSTPKPVASTWDQVEERQQRNRGMSKPTITAPVRPPSAEPTTPAPRPRPDGATMPAEAPKVRILGETPGMNRFGKAMTGGTTVPDDSKFPLPWKATTGRLGDGKALTGVQKFGNSLIGTAEQFGSPNPLRGLRSGGKFGVLTTFASAMAISGATAKMQEDALVKDFMAQQYPEDVARSMAAAYVGSYSATAGVANLAAEGAADATFMAASATAGAAIGAAFFGIGAIPGFFAGAAAGWAASRVAAGASAIVNIAEAAFSMGNVATGNGGFVNLPSLDDYWVHGGINEDGSKRNGLLGLNFRAAAAEGADSTALSAARAVVDLANPGRFLTDEQAIQEEERIQTGYYADSSDIDPKYDDYFQFIQEGYFVKRDTSGNYKVDTQAVQKFLLDTVRYTKTEDLRQLLPPKPAAGDSFYKSVRLTDEMLAGMWDFPDVMP